MAWLTISKEDLRAYNREWYARQPKRKKQAIALIKSERRRRIQRELKAYKKTLKCKKCGENHPACLDFHHSHKDKEITVSDAQRRGWSLLRIKKEISKCVVLCSNCHRKYHQGVA